MGRSFGDDLLQSSLPLFYYRLSTSKCALRALRSEKTSHNSRAAPLRFAAATRNFFPQTAQHQPKNVRRSKMRRSLNWIFKKSPKLKKRGAASRRRRSVGGRRSRAPRTNNTKNKPRLCISVRLLMHNLLLALFFKKKKCIARAFKWSIGSRFHRHRGPPLSFWFSFYFLYFSRIFLRILFVLLSVPSSLLVVVYEFFQKAMNTSREKRPRPHRARLNNEFFLSGTLHYQLIELRCESSSTLIVELDKFFFIFFYWPPEFYRRSARERDVFLRKKFYLDSLSTAPQQPVAVSAPIRCHFGASGSASSATGTSLWKSAARDTHLQPRRGVASHSGRYHLKWMSLPPLKGSSILLPSPSKIHRVAKSSIVNQKQTTRQFKQ